MKVVGSFKVSLKHASVAYRQQCPSAMLFSEEYKAKGKFTSKFWTAVFCMDWKKCNSKVDITISKHISK